MRKLHKKLYRRVRTGQFAPCYACYSGFHCNRQRLPRKQKKAFIAWYREIGDLVNWGWMQEPNACSLPDYYRRFRPVLASRTWFRRNRAGIELILFAGESLALEVVFYCKHNDTLGVGFPWERDNGLYTESGIMELVYSREQWDHTWAGMETKDLLNILGMTYGEIKNDNDFIEAATSLCKTKDVVLLDGDDMYELNWAYFLNNKQHAFAHLKQSKCISKNRSKHRQKATISC